MNTVDVQCATARCGHSPFPISAAFDQRARKTHETFYCPAGHALHFGGETEQEKEIRVLKGQLRSADTDRDYWRRRAKRLEVTCQWIACGFEAKDLAGLHTHMRARHAMPSWAALEAEAWAS
jgi:hypothetical protein